MRILKFGGKSLSTPEKMQNICRYIKKIYKNDKKIIIVVSAIGKTTNDLIEKANLYSINKPTPRELDTLLSTGETISASLMAMMLSSMDVPAKNFQAFQLQISTFGAFQNSKIAYINKQPILDCFEEGFVAVVAGFQGINKNNETTTLGRGGSDTTATAMGAIFNHPVEIYSDFNGIFAGDPRIFNFKKIKKINYNLMIAMAEAGAKVLDARATKIAKEFNINIISKSSTSPTKSGTIVSNIESNIISISSQDNLCKISIVFGDKTKLNFIMKNVLDEIKNINFYNLTIESDKISFLVEQSNKFNLIKNISEKLNLLN